MRSKQTLKATPPRAARTSRRPPARPRLRAAQPTGPSGSATRDRLVEAALTTLRTRGFPGTTARAIARTGKLNQALIFYHFGSLDRLLLAALDLTSARRLARYQSALADVTSITDAIDVMSRLYTEDVEVGHVAAVQEMVEAEGFSVVKEFVGHGIGTRMHEDPQIPNFGQRGKGVRLREGMVLAIEPMVNAGGDGVRVLKDGWTAVTEDGSLSAHFEHTVAVTKDGAAILTL